VGGGQVSSATSGRGRWKPYNFDARAIQCARNVTKNCGPPTGPSGIRLCEFKRHVASKKVLAQQKGNKSVGNSMCGLMDAWHLQVGSRGPTQIASRKNGDVGGERVGKEFNTDRFKTKQFFKRKSKSGDCNLKQTLAWMGRKKQGSQACKVFAYESCMLAQNSNSMKCGQGKSPTSKKWASKQGGGKKLLNPVIRRRIQGCRPGPRKTDHHLFQTNTQIHKEGKHEKV